MHHAGANAHNLAQQAAVRPGAKRSAPGHAAVGTPVIVEHQQVMQAFRQGQVWHCIGQHKGQRPHRQHSNGDAPPRQVQWGLRCNAFAGQHKQHQPQQQACRHAGQCHLPRAQFGQQGGAALGVNAGTHVMHPGSPAEERRTDERRTAQVAGGKVFMADQHHHRRADAQGKRL